MTAAETLARIAVKLEAGGFTGLYAPGCCACELGDLAPCGSVEEHDDGWINGCRPGHKHVDPRSGEFMLTASKDTPTAAAFDECFAQC